MNHCFIKAIEKEAAEREGKGTTEIVISSNISIIDIEYEYAMCFTCDNCSNMVFINLHCRSDY